ncbi:glutathione S-transferase family protein [Nitratireductor sp. L1-7-SE]|uniref:Glutathione S-transferase family protein n=1 Tax=Nitratireductor rhodophyticola TaxID=2854036 RepID=A0ABS7RCX4_9HYPH|nr:glutathione S-transferase family protein [Nitratireductor rhodophyticola]MBY8918750.1 glutathione S-transferase family protein [Nitratireductor rhodophyticola]MBY8920066.1 glutathione S-transferase family protein [Nitratireductor rhodophyticola]
MEPILVYGFPAGSSMGLVAALEWLGKPYRLCRVDMLGEMREPSYARINARHETPVLITDTGAPLSETMTIAAWLEARDDERRISFAPRSAEADRMHQIMAYVNTGFTSAFGPLWAAMEMEELAPQTKEALRAFGRDAVIERHDRLEAMVGDGPFLVGERPSLADGVLVGVARWLDFHEVASTERWPKLAEIRRRIEAEPAVAYALALESGEDAGGSGACLGHVPLHEVIERYGK